MHWVSVFVLGFVTCWSAVTASAFADKPTSYESVLTTGRRRAPAQVSSNRPDSSHRPGHENWRPGGHGYWRAPCYGYVRPRRSYSYLYVGYRPAFGYVSPYGYSYSSYSYPAYSTPYLFLPYYGAVGYGTYPIRPTPFPAAPFGGLRPGDRAAEAARPDVAKPAAEAPRAGAPVDDIRRESRADSIARKLRKSTETARGRADRYVGFGDSQFMRKQYHSALQRYKSAIETAPDFPNAYYHAGYALVAIGRYDQAAKVFRVALELDPTVPDRFRQARLYGDSRVALTSHIEAVARAALDRPADPNLLMLVGLLLRDQGEADRADKFLRKAFELAGPDAIYLKRLLKEPPAADPVGGAVVGIDT